MKKIMMSFGMAIAAITGFKYKQNENIAAASQMKAAKEKKKKSKLEHKDQNLDLSDDLSFYKAILRELGANVTPEKLKFLRAWRQGEGGQAKNNPFNTTRDAPGDGDTKYNSHGVRNYPDRRTGLMATVATLRLNLYKELVDLLKNDDVTAKELAVTKAMKKWGTGAMVRKVLAGGNINPPLIVT